MLRKKPKEAAKTRKVTANSGEQHYWQNIQGLTTSLSADTEGTTKKHATACTQCETRKTKCKWNGSVCKACEASGLQAECSMTSSSHGAVQWVTHACRGNSLPPVMTSIKSTATHQQQTYTVMEELDQATMQEDLPNCAAGKKHSYSKTNLDSQSITGQRQQSQACKDNLDSALTSSSGRTSLTMTTQTQTDTILDAINESDEDQLDDTSSQESMDYCQYQKAAIITSSGVCHSGAFSNDSDSGDNSDLDMEIVLNPAPKQRQRPQAQGKKSTQRKPSSKNKIKHGDDSDEELDTLDSNPTTCGV